MNNVFALRSKLSMTQDEFSEFCDVSRISIARYETGGKVSRANAEKIASACGVSVSYVIGEKLKKIITSDLPDPQFPDVIYYDENFNGRMDQPAIVGGLDEGLIRDLADLSPAEVARVRDFVAGLRASREV